MNNFSFQTGISFAYWNHLYRFACIIRHGDRFCQGVTFAGIHAVFILHILARTAHGLCSAVIYMTSTSSFCITSIGNRKKRSDILTSGGERGRSAFVLKTCFTHTAQTGNCMTFGTVVLMCLFGAGGIIYCSNFLRC